MTLAPEPVMCAHGELDCADAEAVLNDTTAENARLRAKLAAALEAQDHVEHQSDMLRALLDDVTKKNRALVSERDGLAEQVKLLNDELVAVEADAVPEGTLLFGVLPRDLLVAEYRRSSRVTRGPLPPSVIEAVETARDEIVAAMEQTGRDALIAVIRREVRRRRRTQTRTSQNRATTRAAAGSR